MRRLAPPLVASTLAPFAHRVLAHRGMAGLGPAWLLGPGAPVEAATSATLPADRVLTYLKLDHARYKTWEVIIVELAPCALICALSPWVWARVRETIKATAPHMLWGSVGAMVVSVEARLRGLPPARALRASPVYGAGGSTAPFLAPKEPSTRARAPTNSVSTPIAK